MPADDWLDGSQELVVGGVRLVLAHVGPAHTPEDLVVYLPAERVLFAGDMVFRGRIPFVGQADSGQWIKALDTAAGVRRRRRGSRAWAVVDGSPRRTWS